MRVERALWRVDRALIKLQPITHLIKLHLIKLQPITDRVTLNLEIMAKTFSTNQNLAHWIYD